jgi:hypothetical protein
MRKSLMQRKFSWVCLKDLFWNHCCSYSTLMISKMYFVVRYSKLNLFADDTLLYIAVLIRWMKLLLNRMNDDLVSLSQWLTLNKLKYKAIILPHLDYCYSMLLLANNIELSYLQKLQNRIMRTILRSKLDTPIRNMLEILNFLSVRQRVTYNTMGLLLKMENNLLPDYLCSILYRVSSSNSHNTRSGDDFILPNFRKASTQNSLMFYGMKI